MNELKYLNICYNLKENNGKFHEFISSYTNKVFKYDNQDELIDLIRNKDIHLVITKYNFELLKQIRTLNNQIQIIAFLDELNHTHLIESLEIEYIKFIREINCINEFIYILKDCVKNIDAGKSNIIKLKNNFIYDSYNKTSDFTSVVRFNSPTKQSITSFTFSITIILKFLLIVLMPKKV